MSYPRRFIISNNNIVHVFFRCHNRAMLLDSTVIKDRYLRILAKYKARYRIKIFEFNLMDNHIHLMVKTEDVDNLSNFMRTTSSQIATFVNKHLKRDSQVFRERYKSAVVSDVPYIYRLIQYIWLNRLRVSPGKKPQDDPYCSAYWRLHRPYKKNHNPITDEDEENNLLAELLDSYDELNILNNGQSELSLVKELLQSALGRVTDFVTAVFENIHTIGSPMTVVDRAKAIAGLRHSHAPPPNSMVSIQNS